MSNCSTLPRGIVADCLFTDIDEKYVSNFEFYENLRQFKDCPQDSRIGVLNTIVAEATVLEIKTENDFIGVIDITSRLLLLKEIPAQISSDLILLLCHIFDFKKFELTNNNQTVDEVAEKVAIHLLPLLENEWDLIFIVRKITIFNDFSHKIGTFLTWGAICKLTSTNYKSLRNMKIEHMVSIIAKFYMENKVDENVDHYFVFLSLFSLLLSLIKFKQEAINLKTSAFLTSWCSTIVNRLEFMKRCSNNCREVLLLSELVEFDIRHKVDNFKVIE